MPSTTLPPPTAILCAENIALLHLLHSVPDQPSRNPTDRFTNHQDGYMLPFLRERGLTGTLAFLSNLKDGPDHIPAVCVQEDPQSEYLNVLLAVNKAKPSDGEEVLRTLGLGFERIFVLLFRVSDGVNAGIEDQVFTEIISMCSARILCRLRMTPNSRKTPKQPIKEVLQESVRAIQWLDKETVQNTGLLLLCRSFVERAKEVIKLLDAWVKHRKPARLEKLVEGISRFWRIGDLQELLNTIPNRIMDPTARKNLLNTISKVARYREAARFLYRTAKKYPIARQMKVVLVSLPKIAFQRSLANEYSPTLPSTLSRINTPQIQKWGASQVCRLLNIDEGEAHRQYAQQARRTLKDAKIHAEIQLLFYCELRAFELPPRVFCSSKDACFLCNAFIRMFGKVHTPRCHGRLYPGWRLPFSPAFKKVEQRFNREMVKYIRNSLTTLFARQQKTMYADPAESTLLTLPVSASTIHSSAPPEDEEEIVLLPQTLDRPGTKNTPIISSSPEALSEPFEREPSPGPAAQIDGAVDRPCQGTSPHAPSSRRLSSDIITMDDYKLVQGQKLSKWVKADGATPLYDAGHLEVQIEYSAEPNQIAPNHQARELLYSLEWLSVNEAEKVLEQHTSLIFRAESLEGGEISRKLDDLNCFYITAGESVLKIFLQSEKGGHGHGT